MARISTVPLSMVAAVTAVMAGCNSSDFGLTGSNTTPQTQNTQLASVDYPTADNKGSQNARLPITQTTAHPSDKPLNFLIIGDAGTQDGVQAKLGQVMAQVCKAKASADAPGCHFVLSAGDNIYNIGALTPNDPQFNWGFEDIYADVNLPFYLVLGNHDNGATGQFEDIGDQQVEYSYRTDRPSEMWNMPARYYSQRFGEVLEVFAIDGDTIDNDLGAGGEADTTDPSDLLLALGSTVPLPTTSTRDAAYQRDWISRAIDLSPARWKISIGHYNYISNGNYGDGTSSFKAAVEEALCDRVQLHIQGHEHDLRWLKPVETCGRTEFVVSGAGGRMETRPATNLGFEERKGQNGISDYRGSAAFMWASILGDTLRVEWYGDDASNLIEVFELTRQELGFE